MKQKPLIETNPYLQDSSLYEKLLTINVSTSSAIELGALSPAILKALKGKKHPRLIFSVDAK